MAGVHCPFTGLWGRGVCRRLYDSAAASSRMSVRRFRAMTCKTVRNEDVMVWFWIILFVIVLTLIQGIFEVGGPLLLRWIFDWIVVGIALTVSYTKTLQTLGQTAAMERCRQVWSE